MPNNKSQRIVNQRTDAMALSSPSSSPSSVSSMPSSNNDKKEEGSSAGASSSSSLPRILCLHGKYQSASSFANKIAGARRKLQRASYDLHFVDAPIVLDESPFGNTDTARAWWLRDDDEANPTRHVLVPEALEYIRQETAGQDYCAVLGFSQGGTLATALVLSGLLQVQAVVTAGAPDAPDIFAALPHLEGESSSVLAYQSIPKLHFAGETDDLVPLESTRQLCDRAGSGQLVVHEKGHLFPTKALYVNQMVEFLDAHVRNKQSSS